MVTDVGRMVAAVRDSGYGVQTERATLAIEGMTCASCVASLEVALGEVEGVVAANVNLATEKATMEYEPEVATPVDLDALWRTPGTRSAPRRGGERAGARRVVKATLDITGHDVRLVRRARRGRAAEVPGVVSASVNLATEKATVEFGPPP